MFHRLVNHNQDIRRLVEKGYAISFDNSYLVVRDIPYLDQGRELRMGAIVSKLVFTDPDHVIQEDHQIFFSGSHPYHLDGSPVKNLGGGSISIPLASPDVMVERSFSNKPLSGRFQDFFEKIESYVSIISGPAMELHGASPYTFRACDQIPDSVFKINDTLTSRAEIGDLAAKFKEEVVAIIGLGGSGSYLLDFLAKTPVKEIRAFDLDPYHVHNAFRSPGKMDVEEFKKSKAEVYQNRYENFRHGLHVHAKFIQYDSKDELNGVTFAFVCVDRGSPRAEICSLLVTLGIPFIDVGMGLNRKKGPIDGMLRATYFPVGSIHEQLKNGMLQLHDAPDDIYRTNIQISELNALNACLAVIKYKQLKGFYADSEQYSHVLLAIHDLDIAGIKDGEN